MFIVQRARLIEGLERLRSRLCLYDRAICDCKYGARGAPHHPEQCGCPELRACVALLTAIPDQDFEHLVCAAGADLLPDLRHRT